ncbi:MAG: ROK family protein, partial [Clostridia bacterium]
GENMNQPVGNVHLMQKMNRVKVLQYIRRTETAARPQVAAATGLSLSSITNITSFLMEKGLLCESGVEQVGRVGRKGVLLSFCPDRWSLVCVVVRPDDVQVCLTDLNGRILEERKVAIGGQSLQTVADWLITTISGLAASAQCPVLAVGIAVSGLVLDSRLVMSSSLGWKSADFKALLEPALHLPVFVENTTIVRAVWQFRESGAGSSDNMLFVDLEGGVGAAQFYHGAVSRAMIGEIGHTTVAIDGDPCFCGNRGCLEVMCGTDRLLRQYQALAGESVTPTELADRHAHGDEKAAAVIAECGEYLGLGLANLANLFNPNVLYINQGDFSALGAVLDRAEQAMAGRAYPAVTAQMKTHRVDIGPGELIGGMAMNLCDCIFALDFPGGILE